MNDNKQQMVPRKERILQETVYCPCAHASYYLVLTQTLFGWSSCFYRHDMPFFFPSSYHCVLLANVHSVELVEVRSEHVERVVMRIYYYTDDGIDCFEFTALMLYRWVAGFERVGIEVASPWLADKDRRRLNRNFIASTTWGLFLFLVIGTATVLAAKHAPGKEIEVMFLCFTLVPVANVSVLMLWIYYRKRRHRNFD